MLSGTRSWFRGLKVGRFIIFVSEKLLNSGRVVLLSSLDAHFSLTYF